MKISTSWSNYIRHLYSKSEHCSENGRNDHFHWRFTQGFRRDEHAGVPRWAQHQQTPQRDRPEKKTSLTLTLIRHRGVLTCGKCATASGIAVSATFALWSPGRTPESSCPGKGADTAIHGAVPGFFLTATRLSARNKSANLT